MASSQESAFVSWYRNRIGDPLDDDEVYGYWLFVIGAVATFAGVVWVILQADAAPASREGGYLFLMVGLVLVLGGATYRLPLGKGATYLTLAGGVVALVGTFVFLVRFPQAWRFGGTTSGLIVLLYAGGLAVVAAGSIFGPIAGDRRDWRDFLHRAEELAGERDAVAEELGLATADRDRIAEERDELEAERAELEAERDRLEAERDELATERDHLDERVAALAERRDELTAELVESERERETMLAERAELTEERDELSTARAAVAEERDDLRDALDDTEQQLAVAERRLAEIEDSQASFEVYRDKADEWRWRLVHQNRNIIATSGEGYSSDRSARRGFRSVKRNAPGADVFWHREEAEEEAEPEPDPDPIREESAVRASLELFADNGDDYRWRLVHDNGRTLSTSARGYASKETATEGLATVRRVASVAEYLTFDPTGFEVYEDKQGRWRWRLLHRNGNIIADSGSGYATRRGAREAVDTIQKHGGDAAIDSDENPDPLAFEIFEDSAGEFRWRLRHRNGNTLADSGEGYTERNDAVEAAERVSGYAPDARSLSVGEAVFELFEDEGGEHRWRLRHRNGTILAVAADGYSSRSNAVEGVNSVKRNLPNAPAGWEDDEEE